jgi:threonine/homoserine/homoserine lactone efflux protein
MNVAQMLGLLFSGMGVGVVLAAPIGPINVEIIRRGLLQGSRAGWLVGLGALTADTIFATLIVSGITQVADRPALRVPLYAAGALMLIYIGWMSIRRAQGGPIALREAATGHSRAYLTGFLMAALNPMGIVYWLSVGSALVAEAVAKVGRGGSPVLVGGVFVGIFCWVTALALMVHFGRRFVNERVMRWITGISGGVLIGFGLWFALQALRGIGEL